MASVFQKRWIKLSAMIVGCCCLLVSCNQGTKKPASVEQSSGEGIAKFVFSEEIHNFGSLKAGEVVSFTFTFKNEGTVPLIIKSADAGCNCTEVILPDQPVEPGKEGQIEVIYNSAGEIGRQLKAITLFSNAEPAEMKLYIKADVTNEIIEINS